VVKPKHDPRESKERSGAILVVDDEPVVRSLVKKLLEVEGYRVLDAAHSNAAKIVWEKSRDEIELLLVDCVMPEGMSGQELAEVFQTEKPELKVIFLSGYGLDVLSDTEGKGRLFLQKPFDADDLLNVVKSSLERE
jgi:two-component system, cell cycle sensor histidine kinase and response regulator CckA